MTIENFMLSLFNQGALQGSTPSQAFKVTCDSTTTTPDDQALGIVNIVVAFAPLNPAALVSKITGMKRMTDVIEYKEGGNPIILKGPGRTKYDPITLERGISQDADF